MGVRNLREVVLQRRALVGEDKPGLIEAVATEHAAHDVGNKVAYDVTRDSRVSCRQTRQTSSRGTGHVSIDIE